MYVGYEVMLGSHSKKLVYPGATNQRAHCHNVIIHGHLETHVRGYALRAQREKTFGSGLWLRVRLRVTRNLQSLTCTTT